MNNVTFVKPDYYDKFQCIGNKCRHNCCSYNWDISIDKQTYKAYKKYSGNPKLEQLFKTNVKKIEFGNDLVYGQFVHLDNGKCPFDDDDHLCMIHKELGANALCHTCRFFPRNLTAYFPKDWSNDHAIYYNHSLALGCEVVVKLFLDNKDAMLLNTNSEQLTNNAIFRIGSLTTRSISCDSRPLFESYYYILSIAIAILQDRELCFEDRLILLGLYCQKLDEIEKNHTESTVVEQINAFIASVDEKSFAETFKDVQMDCLKQINFLVLNTLVPNASNQQLFFDGVFERIAKNFTSSDLESETIQTSQNNYYSYKQNYNAFMADKQYLLENIFVSECIRKNLPFQNELNSFEGFQHIVALYMTLRFYITCYLGDEKTMSEQEFIDLLVIWGRVDGNKNRHTKNSVDNIINNRFEGVASLAQMALYIK